MTPLETTLKVFAGLTCAPGAMWPAATLKKAPHKPIFLLALLDLCSRGRLTEPFVNTDLDLKELDELFIPYWRRIFDVEPPSSIALPFLELSNEPLGFWKLVPFIGYTLDADQINNTNDVKTLKQYCEGAEIGKNLFPILLDANVRMVLREALLQCHFSPEVAEPLREQAQINSKP